MSLSLCRTLKRTAIVICVIFYTVQIIRFFANNGQDWAASEGHNHEGGHGGLEDDTCSIPSYVDVEDDLLLAKAFHGFKSLRCDVIQPDIIYLDRGQCRKEKLLFHSALPFGKAEVMTF